MRRLTFFFVLGMASHLAAQESDLPSFKDPSEMVSGWYHRHEHASWIRQGADPEVIDAVLARVESAPGERADARYVDSIAAWGPGNWVYEWSMAGERAMEVAAGAATKADPKRERDGLEAAIVYFTVASWPHLGNDQDKTALARARDAYVARGRLMSPPLEHLAFPVGDASTRGYLHLPQGDALFPVLVYTNGSDVTKESNLGFFEHELRHRGIALFTVDLPGIGESTEIPLLDGSDRVLGAAQAFLAKRPELDRNRIFLAGASFGGHAAARAFLEQYDVAGVISMCGPLHAPFMAPPEVYDALPALTIDGVKSRLGILGEPSSRLAELAPGLSLKGVRTGQQKIETPLLIVTTNQDPVAPLRDLELLQAAASNVETVILDLVGHCPPRWVREPIVAHWVEAHATGRPQGTR